MGAVNQAKGKLWGRPFQKGQTGNPFGRPLKVKHIPDILAKLGQEALPAEIRKKMHNYPSIMGSATCLNALMRLVYIQALKGIPWAIEFIAERTEGKPRQPVDVNNEQPLVVVVEPPQAGKG